VHVRSNSGSFGVESIEKLRTISLPEHTKMAYISHFLSTAIPEGITTLSDEDPQGNPSKKGLWRAQNVTVQQ
jgi:hypothetical protein